MNQAGTFAVTAFLFANVFCAVSLSADSGPLTTVEADDPDDKIRCRKVEVTGSLVKKGKVCKTVAEWRRIIDSGNRNARAILQSGESCAGGDIICRGN